MIDIWTFPRETVSKSTRTVVSMECGGSFGKSGQSQIICNEDYSPLPVLRYVSPLEPNGNHAAFQCFRGQKIIRTTFQNNSRNQIHILVYRVIEIGQTTGTTNRIEVEIVEKYGFKDMDMFRKNIETLYDPLNEFKQPALIASVEKANDVLCQRVFWRIQPSKGVNNG